MTGPSRIPTARRRIEYVRLCDVPPAVRNPKQHSLPDLIAAIETHRFADAAILDERTQRLDERAFLLHHLEIRTKLALPFATEQPATPEAPH